MFDEIIRLLGIRLPRGRNSYGRLAADHWGKAITGRIQEG